MSANKEREDFEAWVSASRRSHMLGRDRDGWYESLTVTAWWTAWQARATLPSTSTDGAQADDEAENFAMSKFASRADRDAAMLRELASLRAANSELAAASIVREGYALVPLEPTEAMHAAAVRTIVRCTGNDDFPPRVWRAMLAAASPKEHP